MLCFHPALIVYAALYSARRLSLDKVVPRSRTLALSASPEREACKQSAAGRDSDRSGAGFIGVLGLRALCSKHDHHAT
jgi:hypothetical protein